MARAAGKSISLLVDGLEAEREQGITIDVAYRYFETPRRKFIVADCPGHAQYTRNMATGASTADLAVVLVDARKGLLTQTRRHSHIASLLGIRHVVLAVNKMDLAGFDEAVFRAIEQEYAALAKTLGIAHVHALPVSALEGDNMLARSARTPWYEGDALLPLLEDTPAARSAPGTGLRLPVQWICRPDQDFRGYAGTVAAGEARLDDEVLVLPSGSRSTISAILVAGAPADIAREGQAAMLVLADDLDVGRGDVITHAHAPPEVADQFAAHLLWMDERPLLPGRGYLLKMGARMVGASITEIRHRIDVDSQEHLAARELGWNEVASCNLHLDQAIALEAYGDNRTLGGFILIDRHSNATVAAGTVDFALRRAANLAWQPLDVDKQSRARSLRQRPRCVWFTGLSGSGKSTIANLVEKQLLAEGLHTYLLDGDNVRHGLNKDLGFNDADRVENIRRVAEVAHLMVDAGLVVLVSFISPFTAERQLARALFAPGEFIEVFVDTPIDVAEQRDVKGLYAKARAGRLPNFTGIDSPYERPESPELRLDTVVHGPEALARQVVARILAG